MIELAIVMPGTLAAFNDTRQVALRATLVRELVCKQPACFIRLRIFARDSSSLKATALVIVPLASIVGDASATAAAEATYNVTRDQTIALAALQPADLSAALGMEAYWADLRMSAAGVRHVPFLVAPPPPPSPPAPPPPLAPPPTSPPSPPAPPFSPPPNYAAVAASAYGGIFGYLVIASALAYAAIQMERKRLVATQDGNKVAELAEAGGDRTRVYAPGDEEEGEDASAWRVPSTVPSDDDYLYQDQETADIAATMLQRAWRHRG